MTVNLILLAVAALLAGTGAWLTVKRSMPTTAIAGMALMLLFVGTLLMKVGGM